jgi:hypothetical protein
VLDEVLLICTELEPVLDVLAEINLVDGPEAGHLVFVHLPNVLVLDRQDHKSVRVFFQQRFRQRCLRVLRLAHILRRDNLRGGAAIRGVVLVQQLGAWELAVGGHGLRGLREFLRDGNLGSSGAAEEFGQLLLGVLVLLHYFSAGSSWR